MISSRGPLLEDAGRSCDVIGPNSFQVLRVESELVGGEGYSYQSTTSSRHRSAAAALAAQRHQPPVLPSSIHAEYTFAD